MQPLPETFKRFMLTLHGEKGQVWLDRLPTILANCAARWDLALDPPFGNLSYHYVAPARTSVGQAVVVKACSPTGEFADEAAAMRHYDGHGMAQLLAADATDEVMLLERLLPGQTLLAMEDDAAATSIAASVMRQLWRPVISDHPFPTVAQWARGLTRLRQRYGGGTGPFPAALVAEAEALYAELSATAAPAVLLHGDLHHDNILAAERAPWLAIDPKGLIGEPAYEVGPWLYNPIPQLLHRPNPGRILARRVDQFADELSLDRARVRGWGLYEAVLSAWFSAEDEGQPGTHSLACAALLAQIRA